MFDSGKVKPVGYFKIKDITDPANPIVLVDKTNAIHSGNMVYCMARQMVGQDSANTHAFGWFAFGDNGSQISNAGSIISTNCSEQKTLQRLADLQSGLF